MKFYQIPVVFATNESYGYECYINTYRYLEDNLFITVTEDEMFDLTMLGAGFHAGLAVHWGTKTVILGTEGEMSVGIAKIFNNTNRWANSFGKGMSIHDNGITWNTANYPESNESNKEHDISHMYDDLESRLKHAYKVDVLKYVKEIVSSLRDRARLADNSHPTPVSTSGNKIAPPLQGYSDRQDIERYIGNVLTCPLYDSDLYSNPEIQRCIEDIKQLISEINYQTLGESV